MNKHLFKQVHMIDKKARERLNGNKSYVIWFTGLSGSGKSTLANLVEQKLHNEGIRTYLLDGDNLRMGLNKDLGFSKEDRKENIRRIAELARLFADAGVVTIVAFISPFKKDRNFARKLISDGEFVEVFVSCSVKKCEQRDVKGLYKLARDGKINDFTGVNSPYEKPENPEITVNTDQESIEESLKIIMDRLKTL